MKDKKPTREQIKEFWKWIFGEDGVEFGRSLGDRLCIYRRTHWIEADKEYGIEFLGYDIDTLKLNTLFEYAVPEECEIHFYKDKSAQDINCVLTLPNEREFDGADETYALALFWALWQVKESNPT